jgi:hypothetical protein
MGRDLENIYWWSNYNLGNYVLNSSDINQLSGLYRLDLPPTFDFRTQEHADSKVFLVPTSVIGSTGSETITLSQATSNSLEEFWYGVPSRITATSESYTYSSVVPNTLISSLSSVVPTSPPVHGKLWVTLSNNGSSLKNYKGKTVRSSVSITGRDIHGNELTEKIYFAFNGTSQTKFAWSEVTSVTTEYIDTTASLRIDWLSLGQTEYVDFYGLHVSNDREKIRFWSLGSQSYGSTLQHKVFSADDLTLIQEGDDSKHAVYEIELLNSAGTNIDGVAMCPWPKRRWVIVADGSALHFFTPDIQAESLDSIAEATQEAVVQIELQEEWTLKNQVVTLDYNMKRPFVRVLRTRWSVKKPNGSLVGIDQSGSEIAYSSSGWIDHPEGTTFNKVGFQGDYIDYTITDRGRYVFYLESIIADVLSSEATMNPTTHVDVRVLHSAYDTAEVSITLPSSVGFITNIAFDSYNRPWVFNSTGTVYRLDFHHDVYLVDFLNKSIIVREEYTNLEVDA